VTASRWTVETDRAWTQVAIHPSLQAFAEDYVKHRLRLLRAQPHGFLHPLDARIEGDRLVLDLPPSKPSPQQAGPFWHWRDTVMLPLLETVVTCHQQDITGLERPNTAGRILPPVAWFLPSPDVASRTPAAEDLRTIRSWLLEASRHQRPRGGSQRMVDSLLKVLGNGDSNAFAKLVASEIDNAERNARLRTPPPPSFLALLTEAELLERMARVFRYRKLRPEEARAYGGHGRDQLILEVDRRWEDEAFPGLLRPSPQELWDSLIDESKITPVLAVTSRAPNALDKRIPDSIKVRWIGVHEDHPLLWVRADGERLPTHGYVALHNPGDNALMERKRMFTAYAGRHPSLSRLLASPPALAPFEENPQTREGLEEAILEHNGLFAAQGPPGTGKTYLATQVVRHLMAREPSAKVLVCAKEHFALDHILRKITDTLEDDGIAFRAWRSVSLAKMRRGLGEVDTRWLGTTVRAELADRSWRAASSWWSRHQAQTALEHDQRLATLGMRAANMFFCTTMDGAMTELLGQESFDLVIVEEAGKCYPSELLHALCLGRKVLMIGDQKQLPPFHERQTRDAIDSWHDTLEHARQDTKHKATMATRFGQLFRLMEALWRQQGPLDETQQAWLRPFEFLFDRLATRHRIEEQFRMERPLSNVVGSVFYGRPFVHRKTELVDRGLLEKRPLGDALPPELDVPLLWIDTPHATEHPDATEDDRKEGVRDNRYEHDVLLAYLRRLRPGPPIDMVILTPYNAQKRLLLDSKELRELCTGLTDTPFEQVVRTTDEYQGREAELCVMSLVRNNTLGARAWGFMTEPERLNVMFSRARYRQVVIGCSAHIERHVEDAEWLLGVWKAYQDQAKDETCAQILTAAEVLRG